MRALRDLDFVKWFYFGMHIKRWLLLLLVGVAIMGLGFGYFLREIYQSYTFPDWAYYVTLQFWPRYVGRPLPDPQRWHHPLRRLATQPVAALGVSTARPGREPGEHHLQPPLPPPRA